MCICGYMSSLGAHEGKVSVTICMGLCRCVLDKEARLDRGYGLSVARPGWERALLVALFCGCCSIPTSFPLEAGLLCLRL